MSSPTAQLPAPDRSARSTASLVIAAALLLASIGVAAFLVAAAPEAAGRPDYDKVASVASHELYGGDAYTGIQNAAADTEAAVAAGSNSLAALTAETSTVPPRPTMRGGLTCTAGWRR